MKVYYESLHNQVYSYVNRGFYYFQKEHDWITHSLTQACSACHVKLDIIEDLFYSTTALKHYC